MAQSEISVRIGMKASQFSVRTGGNVLVNVGNFTVLAGKILVTAGKVEVTAGNIEVTAGFIIAK